MDIESRLFARIDDIGSGLSSLLEQFNEKIKYDSHKDRQIDKLHAELQEYKSDLLAGTLRPILSGLVRLLNDTFKLARQVESSDLQPTPQQLAEILDSFGGDLERLLLEQGVEIFHDKSEGDRFNPRRQQAVGLVETENAVETGQIAQRLRPGYEYGKTVLQKERVTVFESVKCTTLPYSSVDSPAIAAPAFGKSSITPEPSLSDKHTDQSCASAATGDAPASPSIGERDAVWT